MEPRDIELAALAADRLSVARRMITRLHTLGDAAPRDLASAHRIADLHATQLGWGIAGWKVGCTSDEAMQILNSPGPFAGRVFERSVLRSGKLDHRAMVAPGVECEFAFLLGDDLPPTNHQYTFDELRSATIAVAPAIELVDSRFEEWTEVGYLSLIADSGANGGAIIGEPVPIDACPPLASVRVQCEIDDALVAEGDGTKILGDPWQALEWLANHLSARGIGLHAGQFVLSGTCTGIAPLAPGASAVATFSDLGQVAVRRNSPV